MNSFEALVALNMSCNIGSIRLNRLLEYFDKPENIFHASSDRLVKVSGITEEAAGRISSFSPELLNKELVSAQKSGVNIITIFDGNYPQRLKDIHSPPIVLYIKGGLKEEDGFSLGIVGSRRASFYGLASAEKFACELSSAGITIVSGMARGIDSFAHKGALKAGGRTVACLGSGLNNIYPPENKELSGQIAKNGAVISEFALNTKPLKENFPRRNRLISGLSMGILVVEAARNSGALITADFALEQGKEVFALPGNISSRASFGTNELIKQGAKLVTGKEDILEELRLPLNFMLDIKEPNEQAYVNDRNPESRLLNLFSDKPLVLDQIIEEAHFDIPQVYGILLSLKLKKMIKQLPGKQFVRA